MPQQLLHVRSAVPGRKPQLSNLELGQVAINTYDGRVYTKKSSSNGFSLTELLTTDDVFLPSNRLIYLINNRVTSSLDLVYTASRFGINISDPSASFHALGDSFIFGNGNYFSQNIEYENGNVAIIGGTNNFISGSDKKNSFILNGSGNSIKSSQAASHSFIIGGTENIITGSEASFSFIISSKNSLIRNGNDSGIIGGSENQINNEIGYSWILLGSENKIIGNSHTSLILGGRENEISGSSNNDSFVLCGSGNQILGNNVSNSFILGGINNEIVSSPNSCIIGGQSNTILNSSEIYVIGGFNSIVNEEKCFQIGFDGDLCFKSTKNGVLIKNLTNSQRNAISSPPNGLLIYNSDANSYQHYNGSQWVNLLNGVSSGVGSINSLVGNVNVMAGTGINVNTIGNSIFISASNSSIISGSNAQIAFFRNNTDLTSSANLVFSSSRLGVGISNPSASLHVVGSSIIMGINNRIISVSASSDHSTTICGGTNNLISQSNSYNSFIGGGQDNQIYGDNSSYSFIGGGINNQVHGNNSSCVFIGGGQGNQIHGYSMYSCIGGGIENKVYGNVSLCAFIGNGQGNQIYGDNSSYSFIGGGIENKVRDISLCAFIGNGQGNQIYGDNSLYSFIGGGSENKVYGNSSVCAFIGNGQSNQIYGGNSSYSFIGGGINNQVHGNNSSCVFIGGGQDNQIYGNYSMYSFIGGGINNQVDGNNSSCVFIGGGQDNQIYGNNSLYSFIGGGFENKIHGEDSAFAFIGGGEKNEIYGIYSPYSFIGGGALNKILGRNTQFIFIGGGFKNEILEGDSPYSFIGGGSYNSIISSPHGFIGGGYGNILSSSNNSIILGTEQVLINKNDTLRIGFNGIMSLEVSNNGLLIRSLTTSERDSIPYPSQGQLIYNSTLSAFEYYSGSDWIRILNSNNVSNLSGGQNRIAVFASVNSVTGSNLIFESSSRVGIKKQNSLQYDLDINGNAFASNFYTTGQYYELSSAKYKNNVQSLKYGIDILDKMNPVSYESKIDGSKGIGLIAEEIKNLIPEVVQIENGEAESISYSKLVPFLINCIKELKNEINELKSILGHGKF